MIRSLAKALGGSTTSLTSGGAGGGVGGVGGGGGGSSSDDAARSKLTKGYFKELLSAHFRQPELKVYKRGVELISVLMGNTFSYLKF